jgi:hypothetical protein
MIAIGTFVERAGFVGKLEPKWDAADFFYLMCGTKGAIIPLSDDKWDKNNWQSQYLVANGR